mgnify:CR=1 FL=1
MKKESNIRLVKNIFNEENTSQFLFELDLVMKTIDYVEVKKLINRYGLNQDPECITFLDDMKRIFEDWKKEGLNSELVFQTKTRITRCFACFYGKNVTAYEFCYQHEHEPELNNSVFYSREFAIFTDIKNNCLIDFGVCNAFLSIKEIDLLDK